MNKQIFLWVSNGERQVKTQSILFNSAFLDILDGNSISTTGKTKHFLSKNASKRLQKCNSYFKMLLKCSKIDSKMQLDS